MIVVSCLLYAGAIFVGQVCGKHARSRQAAPAGDVRAEEAVAHAAPPTPYHGCALGNIVEALSDCRGCIAVQLPDKSYKVGMPEQQQGQAAGTPGPAAMLAAWQRHA
jgi:hypothetical protein